MNPDRLCYPDFDIDYDYERLPEVAEHLKEKYGEDCVVRIAAYGRLKCCQTLEIAAKYLNYSAEEILPIKKIILDFCLPRVTFSRLLDSSSYLYKDVIPHWDGVKLQGFLRDKKNEKLVKIAQTLEFVKRNIGLHASGYIVTGDSIYTYIPVLKDSKTGWIYSEYTMNILEYVGLYKSDLLGLRELTKLKQLTEAISKKTGTPFNYKEIPLEDKETLEAFAKGKTTDIFQFEAPGMKKFLKKLEPDRFSDLVLMNALYRPGPMDYIPTVIHHKFLGVLPNYEIPECHSIVAETYGLPIYQEQIMQIVQHLADYTLAEGDMFRRALAKKKPEVLIAKKAEFMQRASEKGIVSEKQADEIFEILIPFDGYSFNKSHAVAYTMVAYWEMYIKVHYLREYKKVIKKFNEDYSED